MSYEEAMEPIMEGKGSSFGAYGDTDEMLINSVCGTGKT